MSRLKFDTNNDFPFSELHLANPMGLQGGAYFSKIKLKNDKVLIQTPKCRTKNGIHKTEKKIYTDLMFNSENEQFVQWVENLTERIKNLIYEKKDIWFQNDMSFDDIEYYWQDLLRSYRKNNLLLRCSIKRPKNISRNELVMVYDEEENVLTLNDIKKDSLIIPLLEITGLKFTSQSFVLEFGLRQTMILDPVQNMSKCLIKISKNLEEEEIQLDEQETNISRESESNVMKESMDEEDTDEVNEEDTETLVEEELNEKIINEDSADENSNKLTENNVKLDQNDFVGKLETFSVDCSNNSIEDVISKTNEIKDTDETSLEKKEDVNINQENADEVSNTLEKNSELNEINLECPETGDTITLKKPNEVYIEIYNEALRRAREAKKAAIEAYLEVKKIKNKFMLNEIVNSDDESELKEE